MEIRYQLKKSEFFYACTYLVWQQYREQLCSRRRSLILAVLSMLALLMGIGGKWMLFRFELVILLLLFLVYLTAVIRTFRANVKSGVLEEIKLLLEDGLLKIKGKNYTEWSADQIYRVLQKRKFLMIVRKLPLGQKLYLIIPSRIFAGGLQKEELLRQLGDAVSKAVEKKETEEKQALYQGVYYMDKSMLYRSLTAVNSRMLYEKKSVRIKNIMEKRFSRTVERLLRQNYFQDSLGEWHYKIYEDHMQFGSKAGENYLEWESCHGMIEILDMYLFYSDKTGYLFSVPKQMIEKEDREAFLQLCREKLLHGISMGDKTQKMQKHRMPIAVQVLLILLVPVLCMAVVSTLMYFRIKTDHTDHSPGHTQEKYDEDFVFHPEDYPDYLPIEKQIEVLTELGFDVPESALEYYHDQMKDDEYEKLRVEGDPYYAILSDLGAPHYDVYTSKFMGYSEQVYWFDLEGWDISSDYINILEGVQALTDEEVVFVDGTEYCDDVNWNKGTGTIRITFWYNKHPYEYKAEVDADWLDEGFISFLGTVMEKEQCQKQLYMSYDNGQGIILFYQDEGWAKDFEENTGIQLIKV